jgi:nicotinamidase-related amidase
MDHSLLLSKKGTVLLVIDVQDKFRKVVPKFDELVGNIVRLVLTFQMYDMPIIVTEQYPAGLGGTVEPIRKLFTFLDVVEKMELAATDNPHFWPQVNARASDTFVVCGIETHVCINQTVIKLLEKGMQVHVVADAVNSRNVLDHNVGLRKMERAGATIATTEMCLFELAEKAGTESFKNIQRMVKGKPLFGQSVILGVQPKAASSIEAIKNGLPATPAAQKAEENPSSAVQDIDSDKKNPADSEPDEVLDMVDTISASGSETPKQSAETAPVEAANETGASDGPVASQVEAVLDAIGAEKSPPKAIGEKIEEENDKDIQEIDKLIGNFDIKDTEDK